MLPRVEEHSMVDPSQQTDGDRAYAAAMATYFDRTIGGNIDKLRNFAKFVPRQTLSLFLAKHELFRRVVGIHGHIIECGVFLGGGLMTWAQLSAIYESVNHCRRIVGFDTFTGFPEPAPEDNGHPLEYAKEGGLAADAQEDLRECVRLFDMNRPLGHIPRVEVVAGDATETIPQYVQENQHLVVAMLYLDFDVYKPTRVALEQLLPRMPKGAVLAFDELNQPYWPGETKAVLEAVGIRRLRIERFPFTPQLSFAVLE